MTTGERMRLRRKELGLSADEVADALRVSRATIFRYESGDIEKVPGKALAPLAGVLKTTPAYLMGWEDDPYDYDKDEEGRLASIPSAQFEQLLDVNDGEEKEMLLLARHMSPLPKEAREDLVEHFRKTIDTYLKARGLSEMEDK